MKKMRSYRLSWETRIKLRSLKIKLGKNETEIIEEAVKEFYENL